MFFLNETYIFRDDVNFASSAKGVKLLYQNDFRKFYFDCSTPFRKWVVAKFTVHRAGSKGYAISLHECSIRIKGTMMNRGPFVVVTPKDNLWIRIRTVMDHCHCCACNKFWICDVMKIKNKVIPSSKCNSLL